jgi:hypothetical protein
LSKYSLGEEPIGSRRVSASVSYMGISTVVGGGLKLELGVISSNPKTGQIVGNLQPRLP